MRTTPTVAAIVIATVLATAPGGAALAAPTPRRSSRNRMAYPATRTDKIVDKLFGTDVPDPYRWLEDGKSAEVQAWMKAEDELARSSLAALPHRDAIAKRLRELYYIDAISPPVHRGARYFYTRRHATKEKAIVYWREGASGAEHVLLDPNTLSADGSIALGTWVPSWDGRRVAYALHANNSDEATLHVMDVATGEVSKIDEIEGGKYATPSWTPSGDGFYYTYLPPVGGAITVDERPGWAEVRFHELGTDPKTDALVHERTGSAEKFLGASLSRDGRWLFLYVVHGWNATDVWFRDLQAQQPAWTPLAVGHDAKYSVEAWQGRFYVHTNEGAPRYRLFVVDPAHAQRVAWREIVAEDARAVLEGASIVGGQLALGWMRDAHEELELRTLDGRPLRAIALPGLGSVTGPYGNPDEDEAYYAFDSFTQPPEIFKFSVKTGQTETWAKIEVPVDPAPYVVEQVWYESKDKTRVSMFLVHRKDAPRDGSLPLLLNGYGGFNISELSTFQSRLYPWLEAGGAFALPNLRGGGEYGEAWHKGGMRANKQNVFDDYIAAAEYLVREGWTRPERLAIWGGSNGGLLVGAALTQRPDLYRAVICEVPLLDMVRYHKFGSGRTWISEYGSADDEAGFRTLLAYSPYHHVRAGVRYPAVLMMSADSDDRVDPLHARKMVAALQAATAAKRDERPILLRVERHAGHGGADLLRQAVEQRADMLAFLMQQLGPMPGIRR